jgi:putative alpha-1,2-mannosidase
MQDLTRYMDPFFGNGTIDLPEPEGIAATWFFIKAQTGNTYPGACAPFGMLSACAYSGAYPTGYGLNAPNTNSTPRQAFDRLVASGFTHLQQSGTGAIDTYYNYLRVTPLTGELKELGTRWELEDERASPGYYAATLGDTGIRAELTASPRAALHRYTFPQTAGEARLAVDFGTGGIDFARMRTYPTEAEVTLVTSNVAQGRIVMAGMTLYAYLETDAPDASSALWVEGRELEQHVLALDGITEENYQPFGALFTFDPTGQPTVHVRVGFSLRSVEQARRNALENGDKPFDQVVAETRKLWNACANHVQVEGGTAAQREVFYSSLYHSLVKPADWGGESPYWDDEPFYVDFATMWDQYKTQLPLILTLYPERGRDIVNTLIALGEHAGGFPSGFVLNADLHQFDNQARWPIRPSPTRTIAASTASTGSARWGPWSSTCARSATATTWSRAWSIP